MGLSQNIINSGKGMLGLANPFHGKSALLRPLESAVAPVVTGAGVTAGTFGHGQDEGLAGDKGDGFGQQLNQLYGQGARMSGPYVQNGAPVQPSNMPAIATAPPQPAAPMAPLQKPQQQPADPMAQFGQALLQLIQQ